MVRNELLSQEEDEEVINVDDIHMVNKSLEKMLSR
jgi:Holliday junction resolvasome RuvABC ATP-dependent DNA helicase subunit